ncbi:UNVERIFIED_CONTAM: hypothetical protein HDU68_005314 [Siphonaria sp. JEL0065]|nr:hypothetical protein HDU68_005314 [Siphonaria sp. JEL0065]
MKLLALALASFIQGTLATPVIYNQGVSNSGTTSSTLKPSFPAYNGVDGPPIGAYICNQNQIYQLNYVTVTTVDWILISTCANGLVCKISMVPNDEFVGCDFP